MIVTNILFLGTQVRNEILVWFNLFLSTFVLRSLLNILRDSTFFAPSSYLRTRLALAIFVWTKRFPTVPCHVTFHPVNREKNGGSEAWPADWRGIVSRIGCQLVPFFLWRNSSCHIAQHFGSHYPCVQPFLVGRYWAVAVMLETKRWVVLSSGRKCCLHRIFLLVERWILLNFCIASEALTVWMLVFVYHWRLNFLRPFFQLFFWKHFFFNYPNPYHCKQPMQRWID